MGARAKEVVHYKKHAKAAAIVRIGCFLVVFQPVLFAARPSAAPKTPPPPPQELPTGYKFIPDDVDWDHPVYQTSFESTETLKDWRLEGGKRMTIAGGSLLLESEAGSTQSEANANHLVCWLTREVPADFLLEFTVKPENRKQGLNIVFFNARGLNGENIFEPPIKPRTGIFAQYHSSDINCYHISYWAGDRGTAHVRKNKGFHLVAVGTDLVVNGPPDVFQTIRIYKRGGMIRLMVDDIVSVAYDDDGKTFGPVHTHSGWIGLRQMAHTVKCEYGHLNIWPLKTMSPSATGKNRPAESGPNP
ncbi:MAG: YesU family protein [Candidatus Sumerlaeia bacterium]|nr:YesU family protein [Candidatus Sumerlaeia bacterium]